jgi:hypothetical protein
MRLSADKVSHLSHLILKDLMGKDAIEVFADDGPIRHEIRDIINKELQLAENVDKKVEAKLESYSKKIYEGTDEWNVLYQKFYNEEMTKLGRNG